MSESNGGNSIKPHNGIGLANARGQGFAYIVDSTVVGPGSGYDRVNVLEQYWMRDIVKAIEQSSL